MTPDSTRFGNASVLNTVLDSDAADDLGQQILRIRRIGRRLFDVPNCIVTFDGIHPSGIEAERSMESIETDFCDSMPAPIEFQQVSDARDDPALSQHRLVLGAPYIRFYATCPILNEEREAIGSVSLIDYAPRTLDDQERQFLMDLAALVEKELRIGLLSATQLDLVKKNRSLRRESLIDPLIGTWNRTAITRSLAIEMERCSQAERPLSVVFVDADSFKKINDEHGRPAGDTILLKIASRLRSCIRPHDALGRYDGGKFMIILPGASHVIAQAVAERMRLAIMSHQETIGQVAINLTISAGTASTDQFPLDGPDELTNHADAALYSAKNAGRNRVIQATPNSFI